jgi:hypothetical protein
MDSIVDDKICKQLPSPRVSSLITVLAGFLTRFVDQKIGFFPSHPQNANSGCGKNHKKLTVAGAVSDFNRIPF